MWTIEIKKSIILYSLMALLFMLPNLSQAQEFNLNNQESSLTVYGTSSLHDWHIIAETKSGKMVFEDMETGQLVKCDFTVLAESLKSGKKAMDKNTYKALNTNAYKNISFQLVDVKDVEKNGIGKFLLKCTGNLTITNTKKLIPIAFNVEIADGKITLMGEKTIKMTDFNIEPPKALLGTITTGNDITIKFKTIYK